MANILLSETQIQMIKNQLLKEDLDNRYRKTVEVEIDNYGILFKGKEIDYITPPQIELSFLIDQEHRSWGVKSITLYAIKGPDSIDVDVSYYISEDDSETETISIPLNWDLLETDDREGEGVITIGDILQIRLRNDENGNLVLGEMSIDTYTL